GMQERLAAGQVDLLDAQAERLGHPRAHLRALHHQVTLLVRAARHEAVRAGQIAERAGHLDPQRVQVVERLRGKALPRSTRRRLFAPSLGRRQGGANSRVSRGRCALTRHLLGHTLSCYLASRWWSPGPIGARTPAAPARMSGPARQESMMREEVE